MNDLERRLLAGSGPEPAPDLRARVLATATPLVRRHDSLVDRAWFSLRWRTAAALLLFVIAGGELLTRQTAGATAVTQQRDVPDVVKTVEMAALELGLTPAEAAALGEQALAASRPRAVASAAF